VEEDLDFEDLGIIEIDDEEWNEEYLEEQKYFLSYRRIQKYQICKKRPKSRLKSSKSHQSSSSEPSEQLFGQFQSPMRPQNQLLRPLTPPIQQAVEVDSEVLFE
jgi:hypothetical protein